MDTSRFSMPRCILALSFVFTGSAWGVNTDLCGVPHDNPESVLTPHLVPLADRQEILNDVLSEIERNYAPLELKEERLGIDRQQIFEECRQSEEQAQSDSPLLFKDRLRVCMAKFQDTHLQISSLENDPLIRLGILLTEVDGRFYISSLRQSYFEFAESVDDLLAQVNQWVQIGTEVLEVNGEPVADYVSGFEKYIDASSPEYRREKALEVAFRRSYAYPEQRMLELGLVRGEDNESSSRVVRVSLPWWLSRQQSDVSLASQVLQRRGFCSESLVLLERNENAESDGETFHVISPGFRGFHSFLPFPGILDEKLYYGGDEDLAVVTGIRLRRRDQAYCYLKLNTFTDVSSLQRNGNSQPYQEVLQGFLQDCQRRELSLVPDLRLNPGGNVSRVREVMSLLARPEYISPNLIEGYINSARNRRILNELSVGRGLPGYVDASVGGAGLNLYRQLYEQSLSSTNRYAGFIQIEDFGFFANEAVYSYPILALVTPECISGCDQLAGLLKNSGRATLLGTQTNGTGAGYWSTSANSASWEDRLHGLFKLYIPNFLFGYGVSSSPGELLSYDQAKDLIAENRPVVADIRYETSFDDIQSDALGWRMAVIEALFPETPPAEMQEMEMTTPH